jgi:hypothetical protein
MSRDPEKPASPFVNPFALWTELAMRMWGFGRAGPREAPPAKPVVAVIPSHDEAPPRRKPARRAAKPKKAGRKRVARGRARR